MKPSEAIKLLEEVVVFNLQQAASNAGNDTYLVPFLVGNPGIGKTAIGKQVATKLGLPYEQIILAQYDAGELGGLVNFSEDGKYMTKARPDYLPHEGAGIFCLDELPQAFVANQNVASQMVNEWRVGKHVIPRGWTIIATGNPPEARAGTNPIPTHLKDRLTFIRVEPDIDDWLAYAARGDLNPSIRGFLRQHPDKLSDFTVGADANPSPRSWEKVNAILTLNVPDHIRQESIVGQIGQSTAIAFKAFSKVADRIPTVESIVKDPKGSPVFTNKDADLLYILSAALASHTKAANIDAMMTYWSRQPNQEFTAQFVRDLRAKDPELIKSAAIRKWLIGPGSGLIERS